MKLFLKDEHVNDAHEIIQKQVLADILTHFSQPFETYEFPTYHVIVGDVLPDVHHTETEQSSDGVTIYFSGEGELSNIGFIVRTLIEREYAFERELDDGKGTIVEDDVFVNLRLESPRIYATLTDWLFTLKISLVNTTDTHAMFRVQETMTNSFGPIIFHGHVGRIFEEQYTVLDSDVTSSPSMPEDVMNWNEREAVDAAVLDEMTDIEEVVDINLRETANEMYRRLEPDTVAGLNSALIELPLEWFATEDPMKTQGGV